MEKREIYRDFKRRLKKLRRGSSKSCSRTLETQTLKMMDVTEVSGIVLFKET